MAKNKYTLSPGRKKKEKGYICCLKQSVNFCGYRGGSRITKRGSAFSGKRVSLRKNGAMPASLRQKTSSVQSASGLQLEADGLPLCCQWGSPEPWALLGGQTSTPTQRRDQGNEDTSERGGLKDVGCTLAWGVIFKRLRGLFVRGQGKELRPIQ